MGDSDFSYKPEDINDNLSLFDGMDEGTKNNNNNDNNKNNNIIKHDNLDSINNQYKGEDNFIYLTSDLKKREESPNLNEDNLLNNQNKEKEQLNDNDDNINTLL